MNFGEIVKRYGDLLKRITGVYTPIFGVSWYPAQQERDIAIKLITFLEDKPALYNPIKDEFPEYVIISILQICERINQDMQLLDRSSELSKTLAEMGRICRAFLVQNQKLNFNLPLRDETEYKNFEIYKESLKKFRKDFGIHITILSIKYGIDLADELNSILPNTLNKDDFKNFCNNQNTTNPSLDEHLIDGKHILVRGVFKRESMFEAHGSIIVKGSIECDCAFSAEGDVVATNDSYTRSLDIGGNLIILGKYANWKEGGHVIAQKNILVGEIVDLFEIECAGDLIVAGDLNVDYANINGNLFVGGNIKDRYDYYGKLIGPPKINLKGLKYNNSKCRPIILNAFHNIGSTLVNQSDTELPKLDHLIKNLLEELNVLLKSNK